MTRLISKLMDISATTSFPVVLYEINGNCREFLLTRPKINDNNSNFARNIQCMMKNCSTLLTIPSYPTFMHENTPGHSVNYTLLHDIH